jgi:8-oxo-dGTP pyrophosphatase MutT (NUDIX family)
MLHRFDPALRSAIAQRLHAFERRAVRDGGLRRAAVAVAILSDEEGRASFVLTRRSAGLRRHGGQWALPGGRADPGENAPETALRELREEVGLMAAGEDVLGLLDDYATRSGFAITPVVVWLPHAEPLTIDAREVAAAYVVPLDELEAPAVPLVCSIPESERPVISVPLLDTQIHAPTAAILYQAREVALRGVSTRVAHFDQPVFAWK